MGLFFLLIGIFFSIMLRVVATLKIMMGLFFLFHSAMSGCRSEEAPSTWLGLLNKSSQVVSCILLLLCLRATAGHVLSGGSF